jgi:SCY1-like protein 2
MASLANLLGARDNTPNPIPTEIENFEFFDVEIKYGLLQISEGLAFLHNDVKLLHRNISPESIIVNRNGVWKISGFHFCATPINPNENALKFPQINLLNYSDTPNIALPNLDYIAPEYLDKDVLNVDTNADMFSLGLLTFTLYNKGKPLLPTDGTLSSKRIEQMKRLPNSTFNCIPEDSRNHIKMLLSIDPTLRPDAHQFSKLHFFEDVLVKTLQYMDSLYQWDNLQKSQFYKGFH